MQEMDASFRWHDGEFAPASGAPSTKKCHPVISHGVAKVQGGNAPKRASTKPRKGNTAGTIIRIGDTRKGFKGLGNFVRRVVFAGTHIVRPTIADRVVNKWGAGARASRLDDKQLLITTVVNGRDGPADCGSGIWAACLCIW